MRVPFDHVFTVVQGKIISLEQITIGQVLIAGGMTVPPTCLLLGVPIGELIGCDLEVRREADITMILGFYWDDMEPKLIN